MSGENRHRIMPAYRRWINGHAGDQTLRELLEGEDAPPEAYGDLLRDVSMHPKILDLTHEQAREADDGEITHFWARHGSPSGWDDDAGELRLDREREGE